MHRPGRFNVGGGLHLVVEEGLAGGGKGVVDEGLPVQPAELDDAVPPCF